MCAVFGIYGKDLDVSRLSFFGLFALQHRGQESSGIAAADGVLIRTHKGVGLVPQVYKEEDIARLTGHVAIGHNRYSTSLETGIAHAQPCMAAHSNVALAHNGNLPSVRRLTDFLSARNIAAHGRNDSELMADAIGWYVSQGRSLADAVQEAYPLFTGAFSAVAMTRDALVAFRDTCGIRPLVMGRINGGAVFASETCALTTIGAEFVREVAPGEMVAVSESGIHAIQLTQPNHKLDIFEFVYFARHESYLRGVLVYHARRAAGLRLAEEAKVAADLVVPVPETAVPVAVGYAQGAGLPFEMGLAKNRYIHRTFIQPEQHLRAQGVRMKLVPLPEVLAGKRVAVVDDSLVRGTTSREIVKAIFAAGAKEVHVLVSSPPIRFPDFYGIDIPRQEDLIAAHKTVEEIRAFIGATSLHYLSLEGLIASTGLPRDQFNLSCFIGEYPIDIKERAREFDHLPARV